MTDTINKIALIVGNGKSTKLLYDYGFNNIPEYIDVYCTSLAFRFCDDLNYNPTYYVFTDTKSVYFQKETLKKKINSYTKTKIWYLGCDKILNKDKYFNNNKVVNVDHNSTGPEALKIAVKKKYNKIIIIGFDNNYTWIEEHVKKLNYDNCAIYTQDVVNHPSYFYPNYLRKGDIVSWGRYDKSKSNRNKSTQKIIDNAVKNNIQIIDFSDNILKCIKSKNFNEHFKNLYICNETNIIYDFINKFNYRVMINIGGFTLNNYNKFYPDDWIIYIFEAHPEKYQYIQKYLNQHPDKQKYMIIEKKCVNNIEEQNLTFYLSNESNGISSLTNFHVSHYKAGFTVSSIRLDNYIKSKNIKYVNFLKIDTKGHNYNVLQSYPWNIYKPNVILCEFDDFKTKKLNYIWKDIADYLIMKDYKIIVSEWYPIVKYGITHNWRCFKEYPCELDDINAWGNLICFKNKFLFHKFKYINNEYFI